MAAILSRPQCVNTLRPRQYGRHFPDDIFKRICLNENVLISLKISLKFVPKVQFNNIPALLQIMAWRRPGDKPLSEPMVVNLLTHIYASLGLIDLMLVHESCFLLFMVHKTMPVCFLFGEATNRFPGLIMFDKNA